MVYARSTIIGRDGQHYPVPSDEDLQKKLEHAADADYQWANFGVSSLCRYAIRRIRELEQLTRIEVGQADD